MKKITKALLPLGVLAGPLTAQTVSSTALSAVDSVNAQIVLTWHDDIRGPDENTVRSRLQTLFELELRKHGLIVSADALGYLEIGFVLLDEGDGGIVYSYAIELYEFVRTTRSITNLMTQAIEDAAATLDPDLAARYAADSAQGSFELRLHLLSSFLSARQGVGALAHTWWGSTGVGTVGQLKLKDTLEKRVTDLAQEFVNAYLAAHR